MSDLIKNLKLFIASLKAWISVNNPPTELPPAEPKLPDREENLRKFVLAQQAFEGYRPGTRAFRNCNPINLKYSPLTIELGAIGKDDIGFAKWATYDLGFSAACKFVKMAANNQLKSYHDCTIHSYIFTFAPPSENPSQKYTNWVASSVGYPETALLRDIV